MHGSFRTDDKGGAMAEAASVTDGVWMYQLTENEMALEITPQKHQVLQRR